MLVVTLYCDILQGKISLTLFKLAIEGIIIELLFVTEILQLDITVVSLDLALMILL